MSNEGIGWIEVNDDMPLDCQEYPFLDSWGSIAVGFIGPSEKTGEIVVYVRAASGGREERDLHDFELWLPIPVPLAPADRKIIEEYLAAHPEVAHE